MNEKPTASPAVSAPDETTYDFILEIDKLKKSFGPQLVLADVSLKLLKGENLVILGKSGSGKSVLIKCVVGLMGFDGGSIKVFNEEVKGMEHSKLNAIREKIGFLFQSGALYDSMTVKQNLEFPLKRIRRNLNKEQVSEKIAEVLENVGLSDALNKMPSQLSGGMRKRISLARTLVADPLVMLYDEPTTGLDPVTSDEISSLILDVQKKYKTSSIVITHDIECALKTANRMLMLLDGTVYKEGHPRDFITSNDREIQAFFRTKQAAGK